MPNIINIQQKQQKLLEAISIIVAGSGTFVEKQPITKLKESKNGR